MYSRSQRLLEYSAIGIFTLLTSWSLWRLALAAPANFVAIAIVTAPLGWLASDLLSGLLHWAFDSLGSVHTPVIGESFIRPFREHHADPQAMTRHDFAETHGASCLAALPLLLIAALMDLDALPSQAGAALLVFIALGALATNQCHKWAHMDEAATPRAVRWLQAHRLVLPRGHHLLHHTAPFDSHYCMSSGWLNRPLNALLRACR
jgi:plasmanylethanolamine desaturase